MKVRYWPTYNGKIRQNIIVIVRKAHPLQLHGFLSDLLVQRDICLQGLKY